MMLKISVSDPALQRELGAFKNPTLPAFSDKLEVYEQARKTVAHSGFGLAAKGNPKRPQPSSAAKGNQRSNPPRGRGEQCSHEDHLLPQCSYPASVKCNTCNATSHISPACGGRQSASSALSLPHPTQLAIGYDGGSISSSSSAPLHADSATTSASGSQSISSSARVFCAPSSRPTPEMPL